ncbi:flavin reductase (DIM6/NTAB) family NADH-FMN oxidoreductase RutF [Anseongella ginsenosidimutans]|uniref:Flavin reductase (DIM6/NTAB) family NADH-FMN oxidoreductase RutF n=1 Tax=Anseongella ginsenosidimutans TaxID=496056 RepID=A0A4V2UUD4_9SPHI|nr:flavin reductase family protein [Anseongella ginsenosidimutans]QEC51051.1 flavin reductase family protein [Anseongella ginsenosidimutans]TCS90293.1 flavin reductase (DIM6/NTAB) family NADH-FMN oxidoreductase RutF [Anseongella ginsenosidimutans]
MVSFRIEDLSALQVQHYLQHGIAPRPICFASTVNKEGMVNLSPFSFFNMFSTQPPICVFSPSRRLRDNTTKHTLDNVLEVPEVVINIVNYAMVQQTSLASTEYPRGVNEFRKAGFTEVPSERVRPPRVRESPMQLECRVRQVIPLAETAGAGNLVIAEVLMIHIQESVLDENNLIDQTKTDLVARLGAAWYCRVNPASLFSVAKPFGPTGIGVDQLPAHIRLSVVLTGNHLGQLANIEKLPAPEEIAELSADSEIREMFLAFKGDTPSLRRQLHRKAAELLDEGNVDKAWKVLLQLDE